MTPSACEAAPLPKLEEEKYLEKADMIIQRRADGNVVALPGGRTFGHVHGHTEEKYASLLTLPNTDSVSCAPR